MQQQHYGQQPYGAPQGAPYGGANAYPNQNMAPGPGGFPIWQKIMEDELCGCCSDCGICCCATFVPCCLSGNVQSDIGNSWCCGFCCGFLCCGCQRNDVQKYLGIQQKGCCANSCLMFFCYCCGIAQQARAVKAYNLHRQGHVPGAHQMR